MRRGETDPDDQAALDIIAERAAVGLWGAAAGSLMKNLMKKVLASHLSWRAAVDPRQSTKRLGPKVLPRLVRKNREAIRESCAAMQTLWEKVKSARASGRNLMDSFSYPYFVQFYAMARAARAYADVHLCELQVMEAIRSADMDVAMDEIRKGRQELAANRAAYQETVAKLSSEPWVIRFEELKRSWVKPRLESQLLHPDFDALARRIDKLDRDKAKLCSEYNIPPGFKESFSKVRLVAVRTRDPILLDGALTERAWKAAPPVDQFVGHQEYKLMSLPCEARLLYDSKYIYLGAKLVQPLVQRIIEPKHSTNKYVLTEEVEFLFVPGRPGREDLYQFVVDTGGNLFTMRKIVAGKRAAPRTEVGWPSNAKVAVKKSYKGWSFELAIPFQALGKRPGGTWRAVLARGAILSIKPRRVETFASVFFNGKSYHTTELYSPLRFKSSMRAGAAPSLNRAKGSK